MEPGWPVTLTVQVAWGEMDAFGHVNNVVFLRWFESARIRYFEQLGLATTSGAVGVAWPLLARSLIDYRAKVVYPDTVEVGARVTRLGNTSFTMAYRVRSQQQQRLVAEGEAVVVMVEPKSGIKQPLDPQLRARISALEGL